MPTHVLNSAGFLLLWTLGHALLVAQAPPPCTIDTFAGGLSGPFSGDGGPAVQAEMLAWDIAFDGAGNLYLAGGSSHRVRMVTPGGTIQTLAGNGTAGGAGDGGPAIAAELNYPHKLTFDAAGNLYVLETVGRIRKITPGNVITTVAGSGQVGFSGDGGPATSARISGVGDLKADASGNVYLADQTNNRVRKISTDGFITTVAGNGASTFPRPNPLEIGDGGPATQALLYGPAHVGVDTAGNLYIDDAGNFRIRKVSPDGTIRTLIGNGSGGISDWPDGTLASPSLSINTPMSLIVKPDGTIFLDQRTNSGSTRFLRKIAPDGAISKLGEYPIGQFEQDTQNRFFRFSLSQVFRLDPGDVEVLVAGIGFDAGLRGDGGPATAAYLGSPEDVAVGPDGRLYIADMIFPSQRIRVVETNGTISTRAITGSGLLPGTMTSVAADKNGDLYISLGASNRVVKLAPGGAVTLVAGFGTGCTLPSCSKEIESPSHVQVDRQGNVYFLEGRGSDRFLRIVALDGSMRGPKLSSGEEFQQLPLGSSGVLRAFAQAITLDHNDNLFIANHLGIWKLTPEGELSAVPGAEGYVSQGFAKVLAVAVDRLENVYFTTQSSPGQVKRLTPQGDLVTVAGSLERFAPLYGGDGGPAAAGLVGMPKDLAIDDEGSLLIADASNGRVRRITSVADCAVVVRPQLAAIEMLNGASLVTDAPSPGALVTLFGRRLGPDQPAQLQLAGDRVTTELGGTRVLFDDGAAPMLYSSASQLNFVVPYSVLSPGATEPFPWIKVEVEHKGTKSEPLWAVPLPAVPAIFTLDGSGRGQGAILNQDLTVNGANNPAKVGEVIVIYATGAGQTDPPGVDGQLAIDVLPKPVLPPKVTIGGVEAQINYAGAAPFLVAGVLQVNAVVPPSLTTAGAKEVRLSIGDATNSLGVFAVIEVD